MNTDNIKTVFADYLATDNTQYAILINGTWGCGKTYFWKFCLIDIAKDSGFKPVYISLNGISKIEALENLFFIKLLPFIGGTENRKIKNITKFVTNIINQAGKFFLKTSLADMFKGVSVDSFNFSNYVFCFDDLERCRIPIKEVLGFLNNYVEHKNLKTIILADEPNIDKNSCNYNNIKEKVIGCVLNFEMDIKIILPLLFKKYETENTDFYNFLSKQTIVIVNILTEYKQENLRVIFFYLGVLERIFPKLKNVDEKYVQELILFSAIISFEFKNGNLKSSDYNHPDGIDDINEHFYSLNLSRLMRDDKNGIEEEKLKPYAEKFYKKYLETKIKNYFFYKSIYTYILTGYIDLSELENEIKKRYPEVVTQEIQDFRDLLDYKFRQLSNTDFKRLAENVLINAKNGKYTIYDYIQIAKFYYYFSDNQLIPESKEDIDKILIEGLEQAKVMKEINDGILDNLFHFDDNSNEIKKIKSLVKKIHLDIKKERHVADGEEFLDSLLNKDEYELDAIFEKHKFSKDLFQYIDGQLLFDTILKISNRQLFNFTELLSHRYNSTNIGELLYEDTGCLKTLQKNLSDYLDNHDEIQQPQKYLLGTLDMLLPQLFIKLEQTKK